MPSRIKLVPGVTLGAPLTLMLTLLVTGCDTSSTAPGRVTPVQFSTVISLPDLQTHLTGPARVQVRIIPGGLVARAVELKGGDELTRPEVIRGRVTAISGSGDKGTLTLELGGLKIDFTSTTKFRPDGDGDGAAPVALADFVARVQAEITAGAHPAVQAQRAAPAQPQAPGDAGFTATELRLDDQADHAVIELNITGDNLIKNQTPPPDGWLKVLGLMIELRVTDGTTKLSAQTPEAEGENEFAGLVQSVDATAGTVTLKSGTVINIVAGTEIEGKEGDADDRLASLADVQAALTAGKSVKAEGEGLAKAGTPPTIDAIKIEFEVVGADHRPPEPPVTAVEFEDTVASVDVVNARFTLGNGAVVHVTDHTVIASEHGLLSLKAVADTLAAHVRVRAEGRATVDAAGPPPTLTAFWVRFEAVH
jgi:hypothetical protein